MFKLKVTRRGAVRLPIPCPTCGHQTKIDPTTIRKGTAIACSRCRTNISLEGDAHKLGEAFRRLNRTLGR